MDTFLKVYNIIEKIMFTVIILFSCWFLYDQFKEDSLDILLYIIVVPVFLSICYRLYNFLKLLVLIVYLFLELVFSKIVSIIEDINYSIRAFKSKKSKKMGRELKENLHQKKKSI